MTLSLCTDGQEHEFDRKGTCVHCDRYHDDLHDQEDPREGVYWNYPVDNRGEHDITL